MDAIDRLIQADRTNPKRILITGDRVLDIWEEGHRSDCQEGCPKLFGRKTTHRPGGAANAQRQLEHWRSKATLIAPPPLEQKYRYVDQDGKVIFRCDFALDVSPKDIFKNARDHLLEALRCEVYDAVLIADYNKGFLTSELVAQVIQYCNDRGVPCVADPRRDPSFYDGAILKADSNYAVNAGILTVESHQPASIVTFGAAPPIIYDDCVEQLLDGTQRPVPCVNHVGAGDCFAAHLVLALAHDFDLREAAAIAHSAGRVFVQHPYERPPWPHEIRRDLHPAGGKVVIGTSNLPALRESNPGRMIFTNGFFRLGAHAGHCWLLQEASKRGDLLVVGINDDASCARLRPGEVVLPLAERVAVLAALECVDWIVPFSEDTPEEIMRQLKPDALVKGSEYNGQRVPGADLAGEVHFLPESPFPNHATHLVEMCRESCC